MTDYRVPLYSPSLRGNEAQYVLECLETSWISARGRFVAEFESQFAPKVGARHGLATATARPLFILPSPDLGWGPATR